MSAREPVLKPVRIDELRPTQITVGFREVEEKRADWRRRPGEEAGVFLGRHMAPVVLGPKGRPYLIDHHHLVLALHLEGCEHVLTTMLADLSGLSQAVFWTFLDNRGWCHPFGPDGRRRIYDEIPTRVGKLVDDPYRSLAGAVRRAGGFAKDAAPFSEFMWADFLRGRVRRNEIEDHFPRAVDKSLKLARSAAASYLPGWCGPQG